MTRWFTNPSHSIQECQTTLCSSVAHHPAQRPTTFSIRVWKQSTPGLHFASEIFRNATKTHLFPDFIAGGKAPFIHLLVVNLPGLHSTPCPGLGGLRCHRILRCGLRVSGADRGKPTGNHGKPRKTPLEYDGRCVNMCWILLILYDIMRNARNFSSWLLMTRRLIRHKHHYIVMSTRKSLLIQARGFAAKMIFASDTAREISCRSCSVHLRAIS